MERMTVRMDQTRQIVVSSTLPAVIIKMRPGGPILGLNYEEGLIRKGALSNCYCIQVNRCFVLQNFRITKNSGIIFSAY